MGVSKKPKNFFHFSPYVSDCGDNFADASDSPGNRSFSFF